MKKYLKTCLFLSGIFIGSLSATAIEYSQEDFSKKNLSEYVDNERVQAVIKAAKEYEVALTEYMSWGEGKEEFLKKNVLRDAYLNTSASHDEILKKVGKLGPELTWRLNEWNRKVLLNAIHKSHAPQITIDEFYQLAVNYTKAFSAVKDHPKTKSYMLSHFLFKESVLTLIKEGVSLQEITNLLKHKHIDNKQVITKVLYWYKKDKGSNAQEIIS